METITRTATCECGSVIFEARGEPFVCAVCYCTDCQVAGEKIEMNYTSARILDPDGGTAYATFRQDQWICKQGENKLEAIKLRPKSPTTRYVAVCCNTPIFLIYSRGFWVSVYRSGLTPPLPPLEWRNQTRARTSGLPYPDDLPRYKGFPARLYARMIKSKFSQLTGR